MKQILYVVMTIWSISCAAAQAQDLPQPEPNSPPLPDGLQTVEFFSPAVGRAMKYDIVLPPDYETSGKRYPVLYLLHGVMQNYTVWGRNLGAAFYARNLRELILVMPDGGNTWFVNYAASAAGAKDQWEDHLVNDVIGNVDRSFRTIAQKEGRAIAGLSMGGFAAFSIGLRHPDMFASLGSTSGALAYARTKAEIIASGVPQPDRIRTPAQEAEIARADEFISQIIDIPSFSTQVERTPAGQDFVTVEQAQSYDPFHIIYTVPKNELPHMYIDAGTEDGLVTVAREYMTVLLINDVPFDFMQTRGKHNSEYWRRSIGHMMTTQFEVMQRALGNRP